MKESTSQHWERYWRQEAQVEEIYSNEDRLLKHLLDLPLKNKWVLEVGAGSGRDSLILARNGARVVLLDYVASSFQVIRRLAEEDGAEVICVCADATRSPFRDNTFDLVFHQGLLEHFREPRDLLRDNFRITAKNGYCLADVPQKYHLYTFGKHILIALGRWFAGWETEFTPAELEHLMREHGFQVVRTYGAWFVPGLFYRGIRFMLRRSGLARLPLYPPEIWPLSAMGRRWRRILSKYRWGLYTTAMIGVLGRKIHTT
ncbi:MAG: class I SAM-dependent methyltransferase [Candidatus Eisenbacteria bacterium]|uniref:Class I SAM-dependent methyltransferase n=1 Tax=Eiseniibacteriota bacterium TaxID=2212470 RepID=A0A948RY46_UNCEI|nr:class I SAM-dependent methyltransferase [Candidatus Eisenbacteria bacterium]MBU1950394.1 class I SAM-dependent methyltransferase [Candidatus Eisenbacteria bacterium]MBU2692985.1 class I SAM-dependent methyltransferase [Candidatus Eisenbacteria bacterium]